MVGKLDPAASLIVQDTLAVLSAVEARVLGTLVEKAHTVPDTYPLSLNALVSGCNQKTSRNPVMEVSESDAQAALDSLKRHNLVVESSGSRVTRYAHNVERVLGIPQQAVAIIAVLMLRGPQTAGELRINCERLHHFADISAVEGFLSELASRPSGALVVELPRAAGSRENRWAQTLTGAPAPEAERQMSAVAPASTDELGALREEVKRINRELARLEATLRKVSLHVGLPPDPE